MASRCTLPAGSMDAGALKRLRLTALTAGVALASGVGLVLWADQATSRGEDVTELRPDLVVERPDEIYLMRSGTGPIRLRTSNTVANKGAGPLEMSGNADGEPCTVAGKPPGRHTLQQIYEDSDDPSLPGDTDSPDFFLRDEDTTALPPHEAGCSRYHSKHDHWHFDNFARYTLLSERTGKEVGVSRKVSFCVLDTDRPYPGLYGGLASPEERYYPQDPEGPDPEFPTCSGTSIDGLSIGWEDTYTASLPGQGMPIGNSRRGTYCLVLEADPASASRPDGVLLESREHNNVRTVRLRLRPNKLVLHRLGSTCRLPG